MVALVLDQLSKQAVIDRITRGEVIEVLPFLDLVHTANSGIAFGVLSGSGVIVPLLGLVVLGIVVVWFARHPFTPLAWLATGLIAGGAIGNLVDRLRHGAVTDFVSVGDFPAFNVADAAITCGVVLFVLIALFAPEGKDGVDAA